RGAIIFQVRKPAKDWLIQNSRRDECSIFFDGRASEERSRRSVLWKSRGGFVASGAVARNPGVHRDAVEFVAGKKGRSAVVRRADHRMRTERRSARSGIGRSDSANLRASGASLQ